MGVEIGLHSVYATRRIALNDQAEIEDKPRRVNPLAQSDISSLTKRSKGVEKPLFELSRLRAGGGDGGREEDGVAMPVDRPG